MSKGKTVKGSTTGPLVNDKLEATTQLWRVSPYNFCKEVRSQMTLPEKVDICDLTLREGRQLEGVSLTMDEVLLIAEKLVDAGVSMLQVHHDEPKEILEIKKRFPKTTVEALVHPTAALNPVLCKKEVDMNVDHGADIVNMALSFSDNQMCLFESMAGARISREEAIERAVNSVIYAKSKKTTVACLIQDFMRIDLDLLKSITRKLVDAGASIIYLDDITGQSLYPVYKYLVSEMKKALPDARIGLHTHNDMGLGTASLYAGLESGASIIQASVNGLGERAGIAPLAEVAAVIQLWYGINTGIKLEKMRELSQLVSDITKWPMPLKMPCVGEQAFSHLVEVHYCAPPDGYWAYTCWHPSIFGNQMKTMLGHYSGPWAIRTMAGELGVSIPDDKVETVLARVRSEIRWRKRKLQPEEFLKIVEEVS